VGSDNPTERETPLTKVNMTTNHGTGHGHTTSGKTDNLGEGKSFSVVEDHTLLMCWSRVA
jgi:hypothetical protein